tara:strand:+ start:111 stop:389 length:279 start_codon:yes stop_codon:yes gene_type:complete
MLKQFLKRHLKHGELKALAKRAGLHENSVYAWVKGRNQPSVVSLIWFLRAMSEHTGGSYELFWIEYIYTLEGSKDPAQRLDQWIESLRSGSH